MAGRGGRVGAGAGAGGDVPLRWRRRTRGSTRRRTVRRRRRCGGARSFPTGRASWVAWVSAPAATARFTGSPKPSTPCSLGEKSSSKKAPPAIGKNRKETRDRARRLICHLFVVFMSASIFFYLRCLCAFCIYSSVSVEFGLEGSLPMVTSSRTSERDAMQSMKMARKQSLAPFLCAW
jgi:hypothetical protein